MVICCKFYFLPYFYLHNLIIHLLKIFIRQLKGAATKSYSLLTNPLWTLYELYYLIALLTISLCHYKLFNVLCGKNNNPYNVSY